MPAGGLPGRQAAASVSSPHGAPGAAGPCSTHAVPAGGAGPFDAADAEVLLHALAMQLPFDQLPPLLVRRPGSTVEWAAADTAAWLSRAARHCAHPGVVTFTASWPLPSAAGPPTAWAWWNGLQQYLRYLTACTAGTAVAEFSA